MARLKSQPQGTNMRAARLPIIEPIKLRSREVAFNDPDWTYEFKYDGFRGTLYLSDGKSSFLSKAKKPITRFSELRQKLAQELKVKSAIFDGEIYATDKSGLPNFKSLTKNEGIIAYCAFDLLWLDGVDLRMKALSERREMLRELVPARSSVVSLPYSIDGKGKQLFGLMCEKNLEGIVAKRLKDPYQPWVAWYKIKNPRYSQSVGRSESFNRTRKKRGT